MLKPLDAVGCHQHGAGKHPQQYPWTELEVDHPMRRPRAPPRSHRPDRSPPVHGGLQGGRLAKGAVAQGSIRRPRDAKGVAPDREGEGVRESAAVQRVHSFVSGKAEKTPKPARKPPGQWGAGDPPPDLIDRFPCRQALVPIGRSSTPNGQKIYPCVPVR